MKKKYAVKKPGVPCMKCSKFTIHKSDICSECRGFGLGLWKTKGKSVDGVLAEPLPTKNVNAN